ncbi:hypothetical protein ACFQY9_27550 [Microvirga aerilata]|uniref:hypothetical protein n=1 Tax=Microvirga aerilata TaxID=670292 RepID=UPI00363179E8
MQVQVFERDLPSRERQAGLAPKMLGAATVEADGPSEGRFAIEYWPDRFATGDAVARLHGVGQVNADLSFRVFDPTGREMKIRNIRALDQDFRAGDIIFNAAARMQVTISVDLGEEREKSEFERLLALVAPVIVDLRLAELTDDDTIFLANELGLRPQDNLHRRLGWLRWCAAAGEEAGLPIPAFYGWAHGNLPELWGALRDYDDPARRAEQISELLDRLAATDDDTLVLALVRAVEGRIIPGELRERAAAIAGPSGGGRSSR